ncbi:NAD-P-binding protein [Armillaria gallica]|uniref:NAD-P-binding protein n=1 Tax=Armillaria gallica TaxID=47427 RepID=A0A2H3E8N6_ARMGA|nr:NAD-P-binding protein [Armillaria gallica]
MSSESIRAIQKVFLASPSFAVVGASKDQTKFGTKVLKWYQARDLDVKPVHPVCPLSPPSVGFSFSLQKESELEGIATVQKISELSAPDQTSISVITNAKITLEILKEAKELSVPALWLQPGAEDAAVVEYIKENGLADRVIYGGPCILVEGDGIRSQL